MFVLIVPFSIVRKMKNLEKYVGFIQYKIDSKGWEEGYLELSSYWIYLYKTLDSHSKLSFPVFFEEIKVGTNAGESPNTIKLTTKSIIGKREIYLSSPNRCEIQKLYCVIKESQEKLNNHIITSKKERVIVLNQNQGTTFQISTGGIEVFQSLELVEKIKPENVISYTIDISRDKKASSLNIKINDGKERLYKIDPLTKASAENAVILIISQNWQKYAPELM